MKKTIKKMMALAAVLTLSVGVLAGCASTEKNVSTEGTTTGAQTEDAKETAAGTEGAETAADTGKTKITLALDWTPNTNHTGIYVAKALGYLEEAGIELEIIEAMETGAEPVVAAGTAQFGISFQDYLAPYFAVAEADRAPISAVAAIIAHNTSGIISPAASNISKAGDLAGHTYATWETPIETALMKNVVEADGASWDEVNLIPGYVENIQGAFETGIEAVWIYYGWDGVNTELADVDTNFFYFRDYGEQFDYYSPVIIGNDDYMEANPEVTKAFLAAVSKGYEYAIENPEEAAKLLVEQNEGLDLELCTASQKWLADQYQADSTKWGEFDIKRWDAFFTWLYANGLIEGEIPAGYGVSNDYLPE